MAKYIKKIKSIFEMVNHFDQRLSAIQEALGRIEARQACSAQNDRIEEYEFKVFSQWGEDGIIQHLIHNVPMENETFVEFGASNYLESNTRFLLINNNWSGLVMDGDPDNVSFIKSDPIYWRYDLQAISSFITRENINQLIEGHGISGDIGLLSVDIDGNDYWVWKAIDVISPRIVVIEYNSRFGAGRAVTIPYDEQFVRHQAHYSGLYFGASLKALVNLGKQKGYAFVGCCSNGVNAFFVRKDLLHEPVRELAVEEGYIAGKFREARNENGQLMFMSAEEERGVLDGLPLIDLAD